MNQLDLARMIATVAHAAKGQTCADDKTPYIAHPERVYDLVRRWSYVRPNREQLYAMQAAWLHDVVEDTEIRLTHLLSYGVKKRTVRLVDLLTKRSSDKSDGRKYYAAIKKDSTALLIKAADRCANLEEARAEVKKKRHIGRWQAYVKDTKTLVLPIYEDRPELRAEIEKRLSALEDAIIIARGGDPNGAFKCGAR